MSAPRWNTRNTQKQMRRGPPQSVSCVGMRDTLAALAYEGLATSELCVFSARHRGNVAATTSRNSFSLEVRDVCSSRGACTMSCGDSCVTWVCCSEGHGTACFSAACLCWFASSSASCSEGRVVCCLFACSSAACSEGRGVVCCSSSGRGHWMYEWMSINMIIISSVWRWRCEIWSPKRWIMAFSIGGDGGGVGLCNARGGGVEGGVGFCTVGGGVGHR